MANRLSMIAALIMLTAPLGAGAIDAPQAAPVWQGTGGTEAAAGGHDPVAYFSGTATPGDPAISAPYQGARYLFASVANRDSFLANPQHFLPAFGGHCGWAASEGRKAGGNPKVFRIEDGVLVLNCSAEAEAKWIAGLPGTRERATAWWAQQGK
jgi:YHS domain-containing protein